MKRTTYILGAGASFQSMPLLNGMNERLRLYKDFIFHAYRSKKLNHNQTEKYLFDLEALIQNIEESTSIDNYANELYNSNLLNSTADLRKLKLILSGYFLFEQINKAGFKLLTSNQEITTIVPAGYIPYSELIQKSVRMQFDSRYRTFFNYFFTKTQNYLPKEINIISWNYDLQIEGTYCRAYDYCSLDLAQTNLNILPSKSFRNQTNSSHVIKLNGTAGVYSENMNSQSKFGNLISGFNTDMINVLENNINLVYNLGLMPTITFAFEHKEITDESKALAKEIIRNSEQIVIIGYSFPNMNNQVDKFILSDYSNANNFYLQIPKIDFERVKRNISRFDRDLAQAIDLIDDLDEFFVP